LTDARANGTATAVPGCPLLEMLGRDELALFAASAHASDRFALALTCRALHAAALDASKAQGPQPSRPFRTHPLSLATSMARLTWGLACGAPLHSRLCGGAAYRGDLAMFAHLRSITDRWKHCMCVEHAALGGHLHVLKWLWANGCPQYLGIASACAISAGHMHVLEYAESFHDTSKQTDWCMLPAASRGDVEILKWLHARGHRMSAVVCYAAAYFDHLEVLQWARAQGCPWSWHTRCGAECAAEAGKGDGAAELAWVLANGSCPELLPCSNADVVPGMGSVFTKSIGSRNYLMCRAETAHVGVKGQTQTQRRCSCRGEPREGEALKSPRSRSIDRDSVCSQSL
jgi:hypothetical protein